MTTTNLLERRRPARAARLNTRPPCQHCGHDRPSAHHDRDAGDATPEVAAELGYCPELAARRTGVTR